MPRVQYIRLVLAYEGTRYIGWQNQPTGPSVQVMLEEAFEKLTGRKVHARVAGRTDSGVHALGQVVCFPNLSRHEPEVMAKALNGLLPEDIVVRSIEPVSPDFDVRGDVCGKHYRYTIFNEPARPLFERHFCWHLRRRLDVEAMSCAATCLVGEHDFAAFRASGCTSAHPIRTIDRIVWRDEPPLLLLDVWGRAFLKQMVRNIVGTFVEIGRGRMRPEEMAMVLESRDRRRAGQTAPARGLCLMKVYYDLEEYRRAVAGVGKDR